MKYTKILGISSLALVGVIAVACSSNPSATTTPAPTPPDGSIGVTTDPASQVLTLTQSYNGVITDSQGNNLLIDMSYNSTSKTFSGTVTNQGSQKACFVQIELNLKLNTSMNNTNRTVAELGPQLVGDLNPGQTLPVQILVASNPTATTTTFAGWEIHPESFSCSGSGPGTQTTVTGDTADTANILMFTTRYNQIKSGVRLNIAFDPQQVAYVGTVTNTTNQPVTNVRVEVHISQLRNMRTELGPQVVGVLQPGQSAQIKLDTLGATGIGWSPHVEVAAGDSGGSTPTPPTTGGESGNEGAGGESGNEGPGGG